MASGPVRGRATRNGLAFLGIPYAHAERFRAPTPATPWTDLRDVTEAGLCAPQTTHSIAGFMATAPQGEDCLNLNIFTPAADGRARPVLVWIHGGAYTHGAGSEALYDGGRLATRGDVVVVTLNYRLGFLGLLSLPDAGVAPNLALQDQVAALRWIQDNIALFGGDPNLVIVFGESAGARSVGCLLAMPMARGLMRRAILQSGVGRAIAPASAAQRAEALLLTLGLQRVDAPRLADIPLADLLAAQAQMTPLDDELFSFSPVVDGDILPEEPQAAIARGAASGVDLLIGVNRDEMKLFSATPTREALGCEDLAARVAKALKLPERAAAGRLAAAYEASRREAGLPSAPTDILDAILTDHHFRQPALSLACAQAPHATVYSYLFCHASPARRGLLGACHALEMAFVFGNLDAPGMDRFAGGGAEAERLSDEMMDAWLAFARTGDPSTSRSGGQWSAYTAQTRTTMIFGTQASAVCDDPFGGERQAYWQACLR